jgi:mRNA-degrading endonuclease RelE of RelBE toxin-antitoxin system
MSAAVKYHRKAAKGLRKLPPQHRQKMKGAIREIADGITEGKTITKLQGREGYKYRQGDWRAIYRFDQESGTVTVMVVMDVGARGGIYK